MEYTPDIIVVSDEPMIRAELQSLLGALGYDVEVLESYPDPDAFVNSGQFPDLLLLQTDEKNMDNAEAFVKAANKFRKTPTVFLTDTKDEAVFSRLKELRPFGFLAKPLDFGGIRRIIELALIYDTGGQPQPVQQIDASQPVAMLSSAPMPTYFFTKVGNKLKKIAIDEVQFVEVEGKYSSIHMADRKFNVKASLKELLDKFPSTKFVRVSRNFLVNLDFIDHIDTMQYIVKVNDRDIPVSRTYKEELMNRISLL